MQDSIVQCFPMRLLKDDGELSDNQSDGRISELFYLYSESTVTVSTVQESVSSVSPNSSAVSAHSYYSKQSLQPPPQQKSTKPPSNYPHNPSTATTKVLSATATTRHPPYEASNHRPISSVCSNHTLGSSPVRSLGYTLKAMLTTTPPLKS